jgi:hypothetical protein
MRGRGAAGLDVYNDSTLIIYKYTTIKACEREDAHRLQARRMRVGEQPISLYILIYAQIMTQNILSIVEWETQLRTPSQMRGFTHVTKKEARVLE